LSEWWGDNLRFFAVGSGAEWVLDWDVMNAEGDRVFADRAEAGRILAGALGKYAGRDDVLVLGLPRGGVPVAAEVARALEAPLDVLVVRKLGAPGQEELAIGAIGEGGVRVLNAELVRSLGLREKDVDRIADREERELERRVAAYRGGHEALEVEGKTVVVVDDGVATGATMRAGLQALRAMGAARIVAAAPVGAEDSVAALAEDADDVVVLETPEWFSAVGQWYEDFGQTTDDEVRPLLTENRRVRG
jgi:putative phosphoribosyl transferase